jgi:hypothetical protein
LPFSRTSTDACALSDAGSGFDMGSARVTSGLSAPPIALTSGLGEPAALSVGDR